MNNWSSIRFFLPFVLLSGCASAGGKKVDLVESRTGYQTSNRAWIATTKAFRNDGIKINLIDDTAMTIEQKADSSRI